MFVGYIYIYKYIYILIYIYIHNFQRKQVFAIHIENMLFNAVDWGAVILNVKTRYADESNPWDRVGNALRVLRNSLAKLQAHGDGCLIC